MHLVVAGYECESTGDGVDAIARAKSGTFDVVVLDVLLPGVDGVTVCRAIRGAPQAAHALILMVTAKREQSDIVLALDSGADDYLRKPFGVQELVARVAALVRRASRQLGTPLVEVGLPVRRVSAHGIDLDAEKRAVRVNGRPVSVTHLEFQLLHLLLSHPGVVFTRQRILQKIWREDRYVTERSVDALVKRLRRKIGDSEGHGDAIQTVWGDGYKSADI